MAVFVALLRAVNVGGTGKLPMSDLRELCEEAGFKRAATYIQSGNVVFESKLSETKVKAKLEQALTVKLGKPAAAMIRNRAELEAIIERNPFPKAAPNQLLVLFFDEPAGDDALDGVVIPGREKLKLIGHELFIHYPEGMGKSKLKTPFAKVGTGRNLNTVVKLEAMARALEES
jgi:uncharacterized protein (DUF1697 family)